jgi:hypothetical protein
LHAISNCSSNSELRVKEGITYFLVLRLEEEKKEKEEEESERGVIWLLTRTRGSTQKGYKRTSLPLTSHRAGTFT